MRKKHSVLAISILFGLNSLFADILYEGARSVVPPYLQTLGFEIVAIGLIVGLAEFVGYTIRLVSGYLMDRWQRYWTFLILGYAGTIAVPLMGIVSNQVGIVMLIFFERIAKGIRSPAKSTIVSVLVDPDQRGRAFGLIEILDELGAMLGPLVLIFILIGGHSISFGLRFMFVFYMVVLTLQILIPYFLYPQFKEGVQIRQNLHLEKEKVTLGASYWKFVSGISLSFLFTFPIAISLVLSSDFLPLWNLPLLYLLVHFSDMFSAGAFGRLYKKNNLWVLYLPFILSPITLILLVSPTEPSVFISAVALGLILGIHESAVRARVADLSPTQSRGRGFGIFYFFMGVASFLSNLVFSLVESSPFVTLFVVGAVFVQIGAFRLVFVHHTS